MEAIDERSGGEVADLPAADLLAFVEERHAARLEAERDILRAAYQWALLHHPDRLPPGERRARERARPAGAVGTPRITEYAAAAFGARIQTSPYGARRLIADAVDLVQRLPRLQAGIEAGTARVGHARHVAAATRELAADEAAWVDAEVADLADGRLAWSRFEAVVEGKVAAASPELARAKELAAAQERQARMSRINKHGMARFTIYADALTIVGIDAAVTAGAAQLAETRPELAPNDRRVAAVASLMNPANARCAAGGGPIEPKVKIYLHLYADSPVARLEGHGPLSVGRVVEMLQPGCTVQVTPVLDPPGLAPADAYEIPARLREGVHLIHPGDVFPFAANTSRRMDLDHAVPYAEGGPTAVGNLGPLTRTHHRIKTHAGWEARHPFPGVVVWRDPYGAHYLVDPTGTRRIAADPGGRSTTPAELHLAQQALDYVAA